MNAMIADNRLARLLTRYMVLGLIAVIFLFPLVFMLISSLKPDRQLLSDSGSFRAFLPVGDVSLDNYLAAFERAPVELFIFNSVLITGITVLLTLVVCSFAGFAFTYLNWRGREVLLSVVLATFILPFESIAIPLLMIATKLPWIGFDGVSQGWLNSYRIQIAPFIADGLSIFLFVQYFKDLPKELIEAARAEGATWWQVYWRIVLPLSGPVLATAAILKFLLMYNQYLWPLMVAQEEGYRPVMVGLQYFFLRNPAWGEIMAYLSMITIPVLGFYLVLQKAFIASVASTGVKG